MQKPKIYTISFASVYPHYIAKTEKKGRTKREVDEIIRTLIMRVFESRVKSLDKILYPKVLENNY